MDYKKTDGKISVIVPVYNTERYLKKCIDSIINQTYKNLEIILIDDESCDNCPIICDEYANKDSRIKVIHKKNGGVSSARNCGLKIATGEFVSFIDGDDFLELSMYSDMMNQIGNNDLAIARYCEVFDNDKFKINEEGLQDFCEKKDLIYLFWRNTRRKKRDVIFSNKNIMCSIWRMLFKKKSIDGIFFDEDASYMEDVVFLVDVLSNADLRIKFVDEYLYNYCIRNDSASKTMGDGSIKNYIAIIKHLESVLNNSKYKDILRGFKYFCYAECCVYKYAYGNQMDITNIRDWCKKENYKNLLSFSSGFIIKLKYFLIYHKMFNVLKLIYRIKGK